jgi:hypothetical protein
MSTNGKAGPPDADGLKRVAEAGRRAIREIWDRRDDRAGMDDAARRLLGLLEEHKESRAFWEGAEPEPGENPFLHVYYHQALEKQIANDDPPEAGAALERLVGQGHLLHEAQHQLMRVLVREMVDMATRRGPFNAARYRQRLEELGR